jgi:23S rRNA (uracil1939-C5)-methyltransferase
MRVHAIDADAALLQAMTAARGTYRITAEQRDLFAQPLSASELKGFDAVVFDPPRAGARAQAEELARSAVPIIAAVSCNPSTFARDARILVDGGYRLETVTPVDQFLWSPHLELVAIFRR